MRKRKAQPAPPPPAPEPTKEIPKTIWVQVEDRDETIRELPSDTPIKYSPQEFRDGLEAEKRDRLFFLREATPYSNILVHLGDRWVPALTVDPPKVLRVELDVTLRYGEEEALKEVAELLQGRYGKNSKILDLKIITKAST
jgi:hypothetical protein